MPLMRRPRCLNSTCGSVAGRVASRPARGTRCRKVLGSAFFDSKGFGQYHRVRLTAEVLLGVRVWDIQMLKLVLLSSWRGQADLAQPSPAARCSRLAVRTKLQYGLTCNSSAETSCSRFSSRASGMFPVLSWAHVLMSCCPPFLARIMVKPVTQPSPEACLISRGHLEKVGLPSSCKHSAVSRA